MAVSVSVTQIDTSNRWQQNNPVIPANAIAIETDTGKSKVGTGAATYANLPYSSLVYGNESVLGDYNVMTYGATGNGVTDDTQAFANAIAAAAAAGGGVVYVPAGTYLVSGIIQLTAPNIELVGAGQFCTTILANASVPTSNWNTAGAGNWPAIIGWVGVANCGVRNLGVNANNTQTSGIVALGGQNPYIVDNFIQNAVGHSGAHFFGTQYSSGQPVVYNGVMTGNIVVGCLYNVVFDGECVGCVMDGNNSYNPIGSHFSLGGLSGLAVTPGQGNTVTGNAGYGGGTTGSNIYSGIYVENQVDVTVTGNVVTNFQGSALLYPRQSSGTITGNRFSGNASTLPTFALHLNSSQGAIDVAGNTFTNAATGILNTSGGTQYARVRDNTFINVTTLMSGAVPAGSEWSGNRQLTSALAQVTPYGFPDSGSSVYLCPPTSYAPSSQVNIQTTNTTLASLNASATTVASGSNGGQISQIGVWATPGAGILAVTSPAGWPTAGTINVAASGPTTAVVTYTGVTSSTLTGCVYVSGSPSGTVSTGGAVTLTAAGSGAAPVPSINTGSFAAPPSGSVIVTATLLASISAGLHASFALVQHGTSTLMGNAITATLTASTSPLVALPFLVTGLTPGTSYNFDLMFAVAGAGTLSALAFGQSTLTPTATLGAAIVMTVQAV